MIIYPRKCTCCEYIANNPAMYSYHKKTHAPMPKDTHCHFGCGQLAIHMNTGGKYTCTEKYQTCPEYLKQLSVRTTKSWEEADERKTKTKESLISRLHNQDTYNKISKTKREKFGTLDPTSAKDFCRYARFIRQRAQQWAKANGFILGKQTYHVDHKLSVLDAWNAGLPEHIVNHPANLQILDSKKNSSKGSKSILTVEELILLADILRNPN